jgi:hypothetical protein
MTDPHMAKASALPTAEEVLAGQTQGGVPRPSILRDDDEASAVDVVQLAMARVNVARDELNAALAALGRAIAEEKLS